MENFKFISQKEDEKKRLDKFLVEKFAFVNKEITRTKIQKLIENGEVEIELNDKKKQICNISYKIKENEIIFINLKESEAQNLVAKEIDFKVIFEDDDVIIIDKPSGLTVHPGAGNQENTLVNALLYKYGKNNLSNINGSFRPGIIHRLDKDTSGLIIIAKNDFAHQFLSAQLQERKIKRKYLAFIYGICNPQKGKIDKNIARSKINRLKMMAFENQINSQKKARNAITYYETKEVYQNFASLVECSLETGRTHQIRVHFESIKHSLIGDQIYRKSRKNLDKIQEESRNFINDFPRQALHSYKIEFMHPTKKEIMNFEIDLSLDLKNLQSVLKNLN